MVCLSILGSLHLNLSIVISLFVLFSVFSHPSACVCLCLQSFWGSTIECHLLQKVRFFLGKYWICWICWMFLELTDPFWTPQLPEGDPTFNITAYQKCAFLRNVESVEYVQNLSPKMLLFCGNVEYVECFWNLQTPFEHPNCLEGTWHSTLQWKEAFFPNMCLSAEMLNNMFKSLSQKNASFYRNVEYVEYVEHFWSLQTPVEHPNCLEGTRHSTLQLWESHFFKNVLLSAEMLNMLNVEWWTCRPRSRCTPRPRKKKQHSTLQLWESHFLRNVLLSAEMLNMLNVSWSVFENVLLSGEMLNMLNMLNAFLNLQTPRFWGQHKFPETFNIFNIFNISPETSTFFETRAFQEHIQHIQHFSRKKHIFKKMLLTTVMLNVGFFWASTWGSRGL